MEKEVTIYDIAELLQLSAATVSRALNDHPAINIKTRQRVQSKANELGYRSNTFASNLRKKTTQTLGVIVPRLNSHFMSSVLAGMEVVANKAGYHMLISQSLESAANEKANARTMFNNRVDGLLVSLAYDTESYDHFAGFIKKKVPLLFFDRVTDFMECPGIVIDNYKAGYEATRHLLAQGCQQILHVTGNLRRNVYNDRMEGYKKAIQEAGLSERAVQVIVNDLSAEAGVVLARQIMAMEQKPDGVFVASDICAVNCMRALIDAGYRIPDDVAFVGFNNDHVSQIIDPKLTTVDYPGHQMGELAVSTMINHLTSNQPLGATSSIVLRSQLIVRASSKRLLGAD
ncbi:LacI family transcriptional regulator [Dyadobacter jejuensis]|uniref:LacI family transcriptional regulator n=1 Tax=Dyadobacter jejuensis TaxID=1082580 RepID=A0A316ALT1_9BACT|nr:LacI family DNA-binding transcriptional regulator [Dyadobacter jejuensis]PWJ57780.1 LacI family transcriptional regulator [Dyadobacter jejuensis]